MFFVHVLTEMGEPKFDGAPLLFAMVRVPATQGGRYHRSGHN